MLFRLLGAESAADLARRLTVAAVTLTLSADATEAALARTVEGITTPLLREEAPVRTGRLRSSLRAHVAREGAAGAFVVRYESDAPYADFVEHGTGIWHVPDAHSAWDGHEGQHSNPFAERAYDRAEPAIHAALITAGRHILVTFATEVSGGAVP